MKLPGSVTFLLLVLFIISSAFLGKVNLDFLNTSQKAEVQGIDTQVGDEEIVKDVIDGDTLILETGEKVRLIGINAPESGQPYYDEAKSHMSSLLVSKKVKLITDTQAQDQYGRILAYIYNDSGQDINLEMIKAGFAVVETVAPNISRSDQFVQAQAQSRSNCHGIWEGLCSESGLCIQISEINSESKDSSKNGEWIELSNTCAAKVSLSGYLLKDTSASNKYHFGNISLESKKTLRLHTGCGTDSDTSLYWACPEQSNFIWNDSGDRAYLYDNAGKLISELGY